MRYPAHRFGRRPAALAALLAVVIGASLAAPARAQSESLIELFIRERYAALAEAALARMNAPAPLAPVRLPTPADTVFARFTPPPPPPPEPVPPPFADATWRHVRRLEAAWFEERFGNVRRAFIANNDLRNRVDTTWTRVLRARLEDRFGPPTRALADLDWTGAPPAEPFQFEYWFVVNDTIPLVVTDVGGPFERGLIFSADARLRADLPELRDAFYRELLAESRLAPYVDFVLRQGMWYRAGYDGARFFVDAIPRPRVVNRPVVSRADARQRE